MRYICLCDIPVSDLNDSMEFYDELANTLNTKKSTILQ